MKGTKVLFLRPPIYEGDPRYSPVLESLGIEYIVAYCREKGIECIYLDANLQQLTQEEICESIDIIKPQLVCITITTEMIRPQAGYIIKYIKKFYSDAIICVGGHFVSYAFREVLMDFPEIDYVSLGEGELVIFKLVKGVLEGMDIKKIQGLAYRENNDIFYNENTDNIIIDLDMIPMPARDYTSVAIQRTGLFCMVGSRGCYANCRFCAVHSFTKRFDYKKWRGRSIRNIINEMEYGINELGAKYILFCDDNFIAPGKYGGERLAQFIEMLKTKGLNCEFAFFCRANDVINHEAQIKELTTLGLRHMFIGVESSSQATLDFFNKGITPKMSEHAVKICVDCGISVETGFIMFHPYSTIEEIVNNIYFLKKMKRNTLLRFNSKLSVYYGSEFIEILNRDGLLIQDEYKIKYKYLNDNIYIIERIIEEFFKASIPLISLFYDMKGSLTVTWHKKKENEISDIINIEQKINDEITDLLLEQILYIKDRVTPLNENEIEAFVNTGLVKVSKLINEYYYLASMLHF